MEENRNKTYFGINIFENNLVKEDEINNTIFSVLIEEFNDGKKIINMYCDRYFHDFGYFSYKEKNDLNSRSLPAPNESFLNKILSQKRKKCQ